VGETLVVSVTLQRVFNVIVLDLCCPNSHRFEGWFASAADFDNQNARGLVSCPICNTDGVRRLPSAPHLHTREIEPVPAPDIAAPALKKPTVTLQTLAAQLAVTLRHLAHEAEDVGKRFPEEARRIHYEESDARSIRGKASKDDIERLLEEGIAVLPVPSAGDLH
jgi:hypothetical protein